MDVTVSPGALTGEIPAPSSKSEAHRLLICAAFAPGTTDIDCTTTSEDIEATVRCLEALGAHITRTRRGFRVRPVPGTSATDNLPEARAHALLDCGESGSTLRFLLPVVAALGRGGRLTGHGRLPERPLSPLYEELVSHGAELSPQGAMPLEVGGRLSAGRFELPGNVSSQYVSGLLMAAPLMGAPVEVCVSEPIESRPYIDLTIDALECFGVEVSAERAKDSSGKDACSYVVCAPHGLVSSGTVGVEGDWSNAAFWFAAGALSEKGVAVRGLDAKSAQGDRCVLGALALYLAYLGLLWVFDPGSASLATAIFGIVDGSLVAGVLGLSVTAGYLAVYILAITLVFLALAAAFFAIGRRMGGRRRMLRSLIRLPGSFV